MAFHLIKGCLNNGCKQLVGINLQAEKFEFSHNPEFDELFDEQGNFAPPTENEIRE